MQADIFEASTLFLVFYWGWLVLAWRFAARWKWLQAFHPDWRHGITGRNAILYGLAAVAAWVIANSALVLLAGVPSGAQMLAVTLWIAVTTGVVAALAVAYVVVSRRDGTPITGDRPAGSRQQH